MEIETKIGFSILVFIATCFVIALIPKSEPAHTEAYIFWSLLTSTAVFLIL